MKTRFIFSVAAIGVTGAIGSASIAAAQDGAVAPNPQISPAPVTGVTGAAGATGANAAQDETKGGKAAVAKPKGAKIKLYPHELKGKKLNVARKLNVTGKMSPFVPDQRVQVVLAKDGHVVRKVNAKVRRVGKTNRGEFNFRTPELIKPGSYKIRAHHAYTSKQQAASKKVPTFRIDYPDLDPGDSGSLVKLMNNLLDKEGYYPSGGNDYSSRTARAILAFRKVNNMSRTYQANADIFKMLADRRGGFKLKYPNAGKHVEADLSRQVMVLANHGKPQATFPVSSGAPATPTIKGHFRFYRKEPGTNSHGMVNSVYFIRGYATHGYASVPTYNASHGCLRNPIPDSMFIYNWIDLGDSIYVYN